MIMIRSFKMTLIAVLAIAATCSTVTSFAQPMSAQLKEAIKQREENALAYHMMRDTMTANSWSNLMRLIHHLQQISSADSVIQLEYADLFTNELRNSEVLKMRLDSLAKNPNRAADKGAANDFPMLYIGLILLSITLTILGLYLLWLLRKKRTKPVLSDQNTSDELLQANQEYETKLAEISLLLEELTGEREKTAREIDELTKTLQRERQQRNTYSEHYEKLSGEHSNLKINVETLIKENNQLKARLDAPVQPGPENDSFISEIEVLHAQLALANDDKNHLTDQLNQALAKVAEMKTGQMQSKGMAETDDEIIGMKKEITGNQEAIKTLETNRMLLNQELHQTQEKLKSLNNSLSDARLMTGQLEALKESFKRQAEQLTAENKSLATEIVTLREQVTQNAADSEKWISLNDQITNTTEKLNSTEKAFQEAISRLKKREEELNEVAAERDKNRELLQELNTVNQELALKISESEAELRKKERLESDLKKLLSGL